MRIVRACSVASKVRVLRGLTFLAQQNYEAVAREFLAVSPAALEGGADLLHPDDAGLVGGLCALATYSRDELRGSVLSSSLVKALLEAHPAVRYAIQAFVNSQYADVRRCLEAVRVRCTLRALPLHAHHRVRHSSVCSGDWSWIHSSPRTPRTS